MDAATTIIRAPHDSDRPYVATSRAAAQDITLTFEARGMLWYLLSKPSDWRIMIPNLQQQCGRDKARRILRELVAHGYIEKLGQQKDESGKFLESEYVVREIPLTENPSTDEPSTDEPSTENPTLHNKEIHIREGHSKEGDSSASISAAKPKKTGRANGTKSRKPKYHGVTKQLWDEYWEVICEVCDVNSEKIPKEGSTVGKQRNDAIDAGIKPRDIRDYEEYRKERKRGRPFLPKLVEDMAENDFERWQRAKYNPNIPKPRFTKPSDEMPLYLGNDIVA